MNYFQIRATVLEPLITEYGTPFQLTRINTVYDPEAMTAEAGGTVDYIGHCIIKGQSIEGKTDELELIAVVQTRPQLTDLLTLADERTYKIKAISAINPGGVDLAYRLTIKN